jgi:hypothetical protein
MPKLLFLNLLLIFIVSACSSPFYSGTNIKVPDGTPSFKKGFVDGCSTLTYARGNLFYRMRYKNKATYNPKMIDNTEYNFGYTKGRSWCFHHVVSGKSAPKGSFMKYIQPDENEMILPNLFSQPSPPADSNLRFNNASELTVEGIRSNANEDIFQDFFGAKNEGISGGWFPAVIY